VGDEALVHGLRNDRRDDVVGAEVAGASEERLDAVVVACRNEGCRAAAVEGPAGEGRAPLP